MRVVHVAGTKGKGSTCAFVESILRHRGLRTGLFTSPHLVRVTERFRVDGREPLFLPASLFLPPSLFLPRVSLCSWEGQKAAV